MERHWEDGKLGLTYAGSWGKTVKFPPPSFGVESSRLDDGGLYVPCMFHSGAISDLRSQGLSKAFQSIGVKRNKIAGKI